MIEKYVWFLFMIGNSYLDMKKKEISLWSCLFMVSVKILFYFTEKGMGLKDILLGCIPGILLIFAGVISKHAIGGGDGLIVLVTGCFLGFDNAVQILCLGLFCSAAAGISLLLLGKVKQHTKMPFVPFLLLGGVVKEMLF